MKRLSCLIQIGNYEFKNVVEVKIESTFEQLTDTAQLTLPRKLQFQDKAITGDSGIFKPGDAVKIYLGYDFKNELIFSGYLTDIKPGTPLVFRCEDEMYQLKRGALNKSFRTSIKLRELLSFMLPNYKIHCPDVTIGTIRLEKETPAQVLNRLNKDFSFRSWFRDGTLYVGLAWWPELQQTPPPRFTFNWDIISHDLLYQQAENVRLKVRAISIGDDNKKTEVEVGDPEGELRTLTYYNVPKKDLVEFAKLEIERMRFTGFRGKFISFGSPVVRHGDRVEIVDRTISDRNGLYIAKRVETTFGLHGYRQSIELGPKV
ncbi:hypothetical protein WBG78_24855 [Chryseolinea sp. T2]|uniref:hypothetical protein n=1 Tax=Chryseolinea sp. T2 TaxID=3129255 RepID=UPI003078664B